MRQRCSGLPTVDRRRQGRSAAPARLRGTPPDQPQQRQLNRQPCEQCPVRNRREQVRPLQHVEMRRRHRDGEQEQPAPGPTPRGLPHQPGSAEQFEHTADQHGHARPWHPGRDDAHLGIGKNEMRDATHEKPEKHEYPPSRAPAFAAPGRSRLIRWSGHLNAVRLHPAARTQSRRRAAPAAKQHRSAIGPTREHVPAGARRCRCPACSRWPARTRPATRRPALHLRCS